MHQTQSASGSKPGGKKPPLVRSLPIVGPARPLLQDPCAFLVACYHRYGPIFRFRTFGSEIVVLAGPEANQLFARHGDELFRSKELFEKMSGELGTDQYLSALDGDPHRHLRRSLKPGFSREAIAATLPRMLALVEDAARTWSPGQSLPVLETMQRLAVEQGALAMANSSVGAHFNDVATFAKTLIAAGVAFRPRILFYQPSYRAAKRRFAKLMDSVVDSHRNGRPNGARHPDLIDTALAVCDERGEPLRDPAVKACAHLPFVNTVMYPSRACGFLLYALLRHPDILERVSAEVDAVLDTGAFDFAALRRMRLLRGAVLENFRLYPIALSLPRMVERSFEFAGCSVTAGATVLMGTAVTHFLPEFFPDPYRFDPDRHRPPRNEHMQRMAFVPFGLGAHACISAGVVEALIMITMAGLLRTIRVQLDPPDYVLRSGADPVPGPETGFRVRVVEQRAARLRTTAALVTADEELADLLPGVDREHVATAAAKLERRTYPPGALIIREGDVADRFYILTRGEADVVKERRDGEPQVVAQLRPGQYFGEIGIQQGVRRTASVRAVEEVEVLSLDAETFLDLVRESDLTSGEIAQLVRRRTVTTNLAVALPTLSPERVAEVSSDFELMRIAPGAVIIRQGDFADRFYVIVRGHADVVNHHPSGRDIHVATLGPGEYFGEAGLLQRRPRAATVRATPEGEAEVMALGAEAFSRLIGESKATSDDIAIIACKRLVELSEKAGALGTD